MTEPLMFVEFDNTGTSADKAEEESQFYGSISAYFGGDFTEARRCHSEFTKACDDDPTADSERANCWKEAEAEAIDAAFSGWYSVPDAVVAHIEWGDF